MSRQSDLAPVEVYNQAIAALNRGEWERAQVLAAEVGQRVPDHAGVHFVAGVAALELKQMHAAIGHLQRATTLNPARADYKAQLARGLGMARFFREAQAAADAAFALSPQDAQTLDALGVVYTQVNAHERAIGVFRRAAALMPDRANYRFNLATTLTFTGDIAAAEREYEACLAIDPRYWKAHLAVAQLRRQSSQANHLKRLEALLQAHRDDAGARLYVNLAIAKECEDLREFPRAFDHLAAGKHSHGRSLGYTPERDRKVFEAIIEAVPAPIIGEHGDPTREPIFVIGMPRSGTTLVERILSSHSMVHSSGELQNFAVEMKRASCSRTRDMLDLDTVQRSRQLDWASLGRAYLESTRPGTGRKPHFIDKLPHNFLYAGFIAQALPKAKLICLRRDPLDTCLSNFRQLFALSSPYYDYSFDLLDTGRYYVEFDRLMKHWDAVLPDRILQLDYESIVDDQEASTRRLLQFCELPWEDACLHFETNAAPVATASAVQVRDKVNRSYLQRWRHYETQLQPLRMLLADASIVLPI
jgi:tetratricopeptide (TPR) repeat protein